MPIYVNHVSTTIGAGGGGTRTVNLAKPSNVLPNDLMLVLISTDTSSSDMSKFIGVANATGTMTKIAEYHLNSTQPINNVSSATHNFIQLHSRKVTASDPSTYQVQIGANGSFTTVVSLIFLRGAKFDKYGYISYTSADATFPAISPSNKPALSLIVTVPHSSTTSVSSRPSGYTPIIETSVSSYGNQFAYIKEETVNNFSQVSVKTSNPSNGIAGQFIFASDINPPQKPTNINVPVKAKVGDIVTPSWSSVGLPTQPTGVTLDQNKVFYELSLYNGSSWTIVADAVDGTSRAVTIPSMSDTTIAKFRVRAYVLYQGQRFYTNFADGSEYTTSVNFQVYNNNVPTVPSAFQTPSVSQAPVKTGTTLRVAWGASTDADGEAVEYELSFTKNGTTWSVLASNIKNTYYDHVIPAGDTAKAQYRVRAKDPKGDYSGYQVSTAFQTYDNTAPSNPGAFSFPKAEDILSPGDVVRVAFAPAVDPEGDAITYELDLSVDGGVNYVNVTSGLPVAFFEYTFPQIAPTETAKYRARSLDANGDYSEYTYSDTFRIWVTIPPEKPALQLLNGSFDIPDIVQYLNPNVAWQFADRNKDDVQAHYQIQIFRCTAPDTFTLVHDSGKKAGNFNVYAIPMNVIQWGHIYFYRVKVWDNKGGESEWSERGYFKPNRSPFVNNLYPGALNIETPEVSSSTPKLGWTFDDPDGDEQVEYFLTMHKTITGTADDPIVYESGFIASKDRFHQIPENTLEDGVRYHWRVSVNDTNGLMDTSEFEYIVTNYRANVPTIVSPVDNHRVPIRPTIEGKLSTDVENDNHHVSVFFKNLNTNGVLEFKSEFNPINYFDSEGNVVKPPSQEGDEDFDTTGLTVVSAWEVQDAEGNWIPFPKDGVDNTFAGRNFRVTIPSDLDLWTSYEFYFGATDSGSKKQQIGTERRVIRVGNEIYRQALEPIQTSVPATRIYLTVDYTLAKDVDTVGGKPSQLIVEACNNALDTNPTWEDMTEEFLAGKFYEFINNVKESEEWAVDFRVTIKAHDSQDPISIGMYGGTFE